ncbi:MAG: SDR family NAD(P)-dependent oxidoreductase [Winogradskyella sp.]|uniref:SDR family NAD(P)-dependent oxidoreductase n=1 Tax=Winogradskyella sp. TaxID=1883156 RepID=UPI00385AA522
MKNTIIITGANRGLGEAFVDVLIKDDTCFIISLSRSLSENQKAYSSKRFHFLEMDLSQDNVSLKLEALKGLITDESVYFINNASIIEPVVSIENLDESAMDKTLAVNVKSTMVITNYLLKNYNTNSLTFVNISSGAAKRAISNWSLYCASKAFVEMFFNVAESEYQQHRFFNINPGVMDTGMQKSLRQSDFPDVENFKDLQKENQLKQPIDVAKDILETIKING